ncbi:PKD domain-containing protein, partial [Lentzea sp. NPDC006480]|uniref:PKD domain-containing protein n=1 Tax=Lentzea sp. NPDC006480 TaxID=3157176 RepID=UPI0033B57D85
RNSHLTITHDQPALIDPEHRTAELLDPETGAATQTIQLDLPADDAVIVSGSTARPRLLIAVPHRGELVSCGFDTNSCAEPVQVSSAGAELGKPVEVDDHAVVPDYSTGQATIVDLVGSRVVAQRQLFEQPTPFELIAHDGFVFFNDPNGNRAGVLDLWGDVRTITKYTEHPAADDLSPTPDQSTRTDEMKKVGHENPEIGLGLPHQTSPPDLTVPAPSPTASIVVEPGNLGVAGDEFELTFVLQPASDTTIQWSFGDGTNASGSSVRHSWSEAGVFTVRATATFDTGTRAEAETTVTVEPPGPPPRITSLNVRRPRPVIGESVHFSSDTTRKPDRWEWTVTRRGQRLPEVTATTAEFDHAFTAPGEYTVALTVAKGYQTAQSAQSFTVVRGTVRGWGDNFLHQLDIPKAADSGVIAIDAARTHSLALKADGSVVAWGDNQQGQVTVPPQALSGVLAIAAGDEHSMALKVDGSVVAWGGRWGQADVPEAARSGVVAIAAGWALSMALRADGSVVAWGSNGNGQTAVPAQASSGVVAIAAGPITSAALKADGSVVVWGDVSNRQSPVPSRITTGDVRALALGQRAGLALKANGSVASWGDIRSIVYLVPPNAKSGVIAMDCRDEHVLAVKADGTAIGWGDGAVAVPREYNRGVMSVAAGNSFSLILLEGID